MRCAWVRLAGKSKQLRSWRLLFVRIVDFMRFLVFDEAVVVVLTWYIWQFHWSWKINIDAGHLPIVVINPRGTFWLLLSHSLASNSQLCCVLLRWVERWARNRTWWHRSNGFKNGKDKKKSTICTKPEWAKLIYVVSTTVCHTKSRCKRHPAPYHTNSLCFPPSLSSSTHFMQINPVVDLHVGSHVESQMCA